MNDRRSVIKEPSLCEMLADPIVLAVMSHDGATERDVTRAVGKARRRLADDRGVCPDRAAIGLAPSRPVNHWSQDAGPQEMRR